MVGRGVRWRWQPVAARADRYCDKSQVARAPAGSAEKDLALVTIQGPSVKFRHPGEELPSHARPRRCLTVPRSTRHLHRPSLQTTCQCS